MTDARSVWSAVRSRADSRICIWCRETTWLGPDAIGAAEAALGADERLRAERFGSAADRRDYVAAHDLLRRSLSQCHPLPPARWLFTRDARGKPHVVTPATALSFSLSHCAGFVGCAVASVDVGFDVERTDRIVDIDRIAERYYAPDEMAQLARCPSTSRAERFVELWTLKEAFVKATGVGITDDWRLLSFDLETPGAIHAWSERPLGTWLFALFTPVPCVRVAVAARVVPASRPCFIADVYFRDGTMTIQPSRIGEIS